MNFMDFMYYVWWSAMCIFTHEIRLLSQLQPLRREVRISKLEVHFSDESLGTVLESSIKNFPDKQMIFVYAIVNEKLTNINGRFSVSKCKDYYVDCVNVISYEVNDMCSKLSLVTDFVNLQHSKQQINCKCPIFGHYNYTNLTFESDKFGSVFGLSTERWWELYWKMHIKLYHQDKSIFADLEFYFLQLRNRNRKH